jgi:glycosyltransferase involved in cell wall biosynthesis/CelD/BcsL family acetyltransferase involved in cellulose biosynthesis
MSTIRLLEVIPSLGCGGAQRMVVNLMTHLDRRRCDVGAISLANPESSVLEQRLAEEKFQVWFLGKRPGFDPRTPYRIRNVVRQFRPHLIHSHLCLHYVFPSLMSDQSAGHVTTIHLPAQIKCRQVMLSLAQVACRAGVIPVAVSRNVAEWVKRVYGVRDCMVIPNGIPIAEYQRPSTSRQAWRRKHGFQEGDVLFVCAARLAKQKNHAMLLEAFSRGPATIRSTHLLLAGDGECRPPLEAQVRERALQGRVHFLGLRADVAEVLAAADVFVLASHTEGHPLSLMEAMAAGLPVVATAVGGVPEIVEDHKQGLLVKPHDCHGMAAAMVCLGQDPGKRLEMGRAAGWRAEEEFSATHMAEAYLQLYEHILATRASVTASSVENSNQLIHSRWSITGSMSVTKAQSQRSVAESSTCPRSGVARGEQAEVASPAASSLKVLKDQSVQIATYRSWAQLEERIPAWRNILNKNPQLSIFTTPEWLGSWWKVFGSNKQMVALVFASESGELRGLAPLYLDHLRDPVFGNLNCLRLMGDGSGDSENLDFIIQPGFQEACTQAFLRWLEDQPDWDACCLNTLSENSLAARALAPQLQAAKWPLMVGTSGNAAISLPKTWQSYVEGLSPHFRPLVTRYPRRLANRYRVRIYCCENPSELISGLEVLFSLHQKRWNRMNQPGRFDARARREFYWHMAEAFLRRRWLEFWFLELNGAAVAAQFCFRYHDVAYVLQEGFDPDFAADKVGYALRAAMLQYFIHLGMKRYDFLEGFAAHKRDWGAESGKYLSLCFARPTRFGRHYIICSKLASGSKEWLRYHLPSRVWHAFHWLKMHTYGQVGLSE